MTITTQDRGRSSNVLALPEDVTSQHVPGHLIADKYRLTTMLAEGGMGSVWLARHEALDARVAIKLIHPELRGAEAGQRLLAEARIEAQLNHPHIVRVLDYGEAQPGDPFLVMELLDGKTLGQLLRDEVRLPPAMAVQILLPVLDALQCAHEHGAVHCDLKPDNIFLTGDPQHIHPKLIDFGIAKCQEVDAFGFVARGTVLGSPAYMSPEQARGELDIDARADVWASCIVLYEAISGQAAFDGDTHSKLLHAVMHHEVPQLTEGDNAGAAQLSAILQRGLAKDRTQRFDSMEELGEALACWLASRGVEHDICGTSIARRWRIDHALPEFRENVQPTRILLTTDDQAAQPTTRHWQRKDAAKRLAPRALGYALAAATCLGLLGHATTLQGHVAPHFVTPALALPGAQLTAESRTEPRPVLHAETEDAVPPPAENVAENTVEHAQIENAVTATTTAQASPARRRVNAARLDLKDPY